MRTRFIAPIFAALFLLLGAPFAAQGAVEVYKTQSKRDFLPKVYADQQAHGAIGEHTAAHGRNVPSTQRSDTGMRICYLYDPTSYITWWSLGGFDSPGNNSMAAWNPTLGKWERNSASYYHNSRYNYLTCMTDAPPDSSLAASKERITRGESVTLTWKSQYGEIRKGSCTATNFSIGASGAGTGSGSYLQCGGSYFDLLGIWGPGECSAGYTGGTAAASPQFGGSTSVSPQQTTTYTYTCTNANGTTSESVTVEVASTLTGSCSASPGAARPGETVTWTATASGGIPGSRTVTTSDPPRTCEPQQAYFNPTCNPNQEKSDITCPDGYYVAFTEILCEPVPWNTGFKQQARCARCETGVSGGQTATTVATDPTYTYFWSGSDGLEGDTASVEKVYGSPGTKTATVTILSGGESIDIDCDNSVEISGTPVIGSGEQTPTPPVIGDPVRPGVTLPSTPVTGPPFVRLTADDEEIQEGESTRLRWETENVIACTTENFSIGTLLQNVLSGLRIAPKQTTDYTIDCVNSLNQHAYDSVKVTVIIAPVLDVSASPLRLRPGEKTRIRWDGGNSNSCSIIGPGLYEIGTRGSMDVTIHNESTFTLTCSKMGYTYQKSSTVRLLPGYGEE